MRQRVLTIAALVLACGGSTFSPGSGTAYRVLFIGNSLTAYNDLPHTVAALAASASASNKGFSLVSFKS